MEKLNVVNQKGMKPENVKKKQVKIVQISNTVTLTATTSQFKGLVQELTGQDSDISALRKYEEAERADDPAETTAPATLPKIDEDETEDLCSTDYSGMDNQLYLYDEMLTSQMIVDLAHFIPLSSYHESFPSLDSAKSLDAAGWE